MPLPKSGGRAGREGGCLFSRLPPCGTTSGCLSPSAKVTVPIEGTKSTHTSFVLGSGTPLCPCPLDLGLIIAQLPLVSCGTLMFTLNFILFFKRFYLFIFREGGREGDREGEKHRSAASCLSHDRNWGPGPQPRHVP